MTETNIKILRFGDRLFLDTRWVVLEGQDLSPELVQKVCSTFQNQRKLAAVPFGYSEGTVVLVASSKAVESLVTKGDDWRIDAKDSGECYRLCFSNMNHRKTMAELIRRCLIIKIKQGTDFWNLESMNIFYNTHPWRTERDIDVFRRFGISVFPIDGSGMGISVDISTAFLTNQSVADYFINGGKERFEFLAQRQKEQKGTLIYDLDKKKSMCYFAEFLFGVTCDSTNGFQLNGTSYDSLYDYYQRKHPNIKINAKDPVAKVSFKGNIKYPKPVAANRLFLRVMNDALPDSLKQVDKISPKLRTELIETFWEKVGDQPFGLGSLYVKKEFWRPGNGKIMLIEPPALEFAENKIIEPPKENIIEEYRKYYKERIRLLDKFGAWCVPKTIQRKIHFAVPNKASEDMIDEFAEAMTMKLSKLTRIDMDYETELYLTLKQAINNLRRKESHGIVVFVFEEDDPATYFDIAYNLENWRLKRITFHELDAQFRKFIKVKNCIDLNKELNKELKKSLRSWNSFIEMNSLDFLQQLGVHPWRITSHLDYEAQLVIDVSHDRRYFGLALLICRNQDKYPSFWIDTIIEPKPDSNRETINKIILRDKIVEIFNRSKICNFKSISSALALRDGRECGREINAILEAQAQLKKLGILSEYVRFDVVDFHKKSQKRIRMWNNNIWQINNVLEGTALIIDDKTIVLANTGAATVHQGTVEPVMLEARSEPVNMLTVAKYVFATAQLNWSSPRVAQRLSLPAKLVDDQLKMRSAQEIKRVK